MPVVTTPHRSLSRLTIAVLVATFCVLGLGQYAAAHWWYGATVTEAERADGLDRARVAARTILGVSDALRHTAIDQGRWDETYRFILGRGPRFFESNWEPATYINLGFDTAAFLALDGRLVGLRATDRFQRRYVTPDPAFRALLTGDGPLPRHVRAGVAESGFLRVGGKLYAYGLAPVLHTNGTGPSVGAIVLFRALDSSYEGMLADALDAHVALSTVPLAPGSERRAVADGARAPVFDESDDAVLGVYFAPTTTLDGEALVVEIESARPVHAGAARAARALFWSAVGTGLVVALLALVFFERRLLRPLRQMAARLVAIGRAGDPSARLAPHAHDDEIGTVAVAANEMLAELEETKRGADAARDAALAASRVKSEFLARMSHEIRTPMNGVLGMTELLERTELSARQRKYCDTIHRSAVSLLDIINDILDFSKIEARRLELQPTDVDVASLVEEVAELLSSRTTGRDLELIVAARPAVPASVVVDPLRLRQVLNNLIGNALKFTEHGEVVVTLDAAPLVEGRTTLEIRVADSGIGIAPEALQRLFEPFAQADASTTRRYGGTGLGLAIARQLTELMGGSLEVTSELGRGSTFCCRLPVTVSAAPPAAARPPLLAGLRVLLGDESATARTVLAEVLAAAGATVTTVADAAGVEAALSAPNDLPDVVLLDRHLALDAARRRGGGGPVPVITLAPAGAGPEPGSDGGVAGYVTKPVRRGLLVATVARVVGRGAELDTATFLACAGLSAAGERLGLEVLVVEDNPVNQAVAAGMLEALGCRAQHAGDGAEALQRLAAGGIDVVLMDCQMPVMDGITATQRLRARETAGGLPPLPVIGVSAHALQGAREECLLAGMNDFVAKPFTMAELARALRRHVRRRPSPEAAAASARQLRAASGTNGRGSGPV
ncbi:MAG: response regulator [Proteobacteria bacterium]|nr:response regulator [Pseudomonadota bacterium]